MMESDNKLSRVRCWLSLAMLLPILGCMIEAVFMWAPDLKLDNWFDQTNLSRTALMDALVITVLEAIPVISFYYICHHIENGWRMPASACAGLMLAGCIGGAVLWNEYQSWTLTWDSGVIIGSGVIAGILAVLYAVRLSENRNRMLSRAALALFMIRIAARLASFLPEAADTTDRVIVTQCLVHGFAYVVMDLFLGMGCFAGFLPSARPEVR